MTDIVERLRNAVETDDPALDEYALEAADEIERLRTENKMLELELAEADDELKRLRALEFELRRDIALAPLSPKGQSDD